MRTLRCTASTAGPRTCFRIVEDDRERVRQPCRERRQRSPGGTELTDIPVDVIGHVEVPVGVERASGGVGLIGIVRGAWPPGPRMPGQRVDRRVADRGEHLAGLEDGGVSAPADPGWRRVSRRNREPGPLPMREPSASRRRSGRRTRCRPGSRCRPGCGPPPLTLEQSTVSSTPPHRCTVVPMQQSITQRLQCAATGLQANMRRRRQQRQGQKD